MHQDILKNAGLTNVQTEIYEFLLNNGEFKASILARNIKRPRGVVYKGLDELIELGLVEKRDDKDMISVFRAEHPSKLEQMYINKEASIKRNKKLFIDTLPNLISAYNITLNKPGIKFYEGLEGVKKVINDTLTAKDVIYTYADAEAVVKYIDKINQEYVKKRDKLNIQKKMILIDSSFTRNYLKDYHRQTTDMRFIDHKLFPFNSVMQIYDGKISYITLSDKSMIGVIIQDPSIYQMHKSIFEFNWSKAKSLDQLPPLSSAQ